MASIKVLLRKKPNSIGQFPIVIRITKDRKSSFIYTGQYVFEKDWDAKNSIVKKSHPNSVRLNNLIAKKLSAANDILLETQTDDGAQVSAKQISKKIRPDTNSSSFFNQADLYLNQLQRLGKHNRISAETPHINHFKEYLQGEDIAFKDITESLLKGYLVYLRSTRQINQRTAINHLIVIRTLFNMAIRDGLVDAKYYPFGKGKITIKFPDSNRIGLSSDEVKLLEGYDRSPTAPRGHALNVWLLSFYFAGMRVSDVLRLRWQDFKGDRLHYTMGKNNKSGSLKIPDKARDIIDRYKSPDLSAKDTVFPELRGADLSDTMRVQTMIKCAVKKFNTHLKNIATELKIEKPVTMHIARHTFGNLSGDRIPIQMLQKLYRHTSVTTTIHYQANFIHKDTDDALDSVIDF